MNSIDSHRCSRNNNVSAQRTFDALPRNRGDPIRFLRISRRYVDVDTKFVRTFYKIVFDNGIVFIVLKCYSYYYKYYNGRNTGRDEGSVTGNANGT